MKNEVQNNNDFVNFFFNESLKNYIDFDSFNFIIYV